MSSIEILLVIIKTKQVAIWCFQQILCLSYPCLVSCFDLSLVAGIFSVSNFETRYYSSHMSGNKLFSYCHLSDLSPPFARRWQPLFLQHREIHRKRFCLPGQSAAVHRITSERRQNLSNVPVRYYIIFLIFHLFTASIYLFVCIGS